MAVKSANNAKSTLASGINSSVTSATVADGSIFPALGAGEYFYITFDDGSNNEIAKVTARSGNTLTIVRAQDNTTARAFSTGDSAELRIIAAVLTEIQENIAAKSANQTVYSATAASNATAYNIGVDPGVEANASVFLDGVYQHHDTFSFSGSTLTFDAAPTNGTKIEVVVDNLINLQSSNLTVDTFTATSGQTAFTLSDAPGGEANVLAFIDGVFQNQAAFTLSSNTLTFDTGVVVGRSVTVYTINPVNIGTPSDSTVTSAKLTGNITLPGSLTVGAYDVAFDSPTFFVDHTNSRVGLGTSSPSVPVDIVGEVKTSSHINIGGNLVTASGDLTLDVAGDIVLDADGGDIRFLDGGTEIGLLTNDSSNFALFSRVNNKDISFYGLDDGATIQALTLDMSAAGAATFNSTISSGVINACGASGGSNLSYASNFKADGANVQITFERGSDATGWGGIGANNANALMVYNESTQEKLSLTQAGNLTVAGDITTTSTIQGGAYKIGSTVIVNSNRDLTNIGTISSGAITSTGNLLLDVDNAEINLKSGVGGTSGAINWTYNTTGTDFASIKLPYDTRASTGLHIDSGYPITIDAASATGIKFDVTGANRATITSTGLNVVGTVTSKDATFTASSDTANGLSIKRASSSGRAQMRLLNESGSELWRIGATGAGTTDFAFFDGSTNVMSLNATNDTVTFGSHIYPDATNSNDIGSSSLYWRDAFIQDLYTQDLHLSNENREKGGNDIDGTKGDWTIQEGEENLYIINNKTGKKFKFALEEVS